MDINKVLKIVIKYADAVKLKYNFVKIILFGFFAKGNYNENSDIDIAIVLKDFDNIINIQPEIKRISRNIDSRIEPHPFRLKDFVMSNPLVHEIVKFGQNIKTNVA